MQCIVASFYHFFDFSAYESKRAELLDLLKKNNLCGSLLIAAEGFNGTLAGSREGIDAVLAELKKLGGEFTHKESIAEKKPFRRTKVRLKKETISLGEEAPLSMVGEYVEPGEWNALIADPATMLIDTRNAYETHLGTFKGALDPKLRNFKELPAYARKHLPEDKDTPIATFCTGGIRCEKFTAWLKAQGYANVYHLKGGILKYLEEIPQDESLWQGECYVFDERVAVGHGMVASSSATACPACGHPLTPEDRQHENFAEGKSCPYCAK